MFAKLFLQISQMDINIRRFKMKGLLQVIEAKAVTFICGNKEDSANCSKSDTEKSIYQKEEEKQVCILWEK